MIASEIKDFDDLFKSLSQYKNIFIVGCGDCATTCKTGGEAEVLAMSEKLRENGKVIIGTYVIETVCDERLVKRDLKHVDQRTVDAYLVMACGSGIQAVAEIYNEKPVIPALNSLFVGKIKNLSRFDQVCSLCGNCSLDKTAGVCAVTRCPKHLVNGPCGGSSDGKCEVDTEKSCAWYLIYERLKARGELESMEEYLPPRDYSKEATPLYVDKRKNRDVK